MLESKQKIVIWCGAAPNQKALACKIAAEFPVAGIVIDEGAKKAAPGKWKKMPFLIYDRLRFSRIYNAWKYLMKHYHTRFSSWPDVPTIRVAGINSESALGFTKSFSPDLVIVSGTALVKEPMLSCSVRIGIINLHTGLSPYVKGAPNCTNWCIANNTWNLVGNTIMWLNSGIDAGNIITTETLDIKQISDLNKAHLEVMEHAHDLYLRAIRYLLTASPPYISVPQKSIAKGELYLSKMWTPEKRQLLLRNWKRKDQAKDEFSPVTIALPRKDDV